MEKIYVLQKGVVFNILKKEKLLIPSAETLEENVKLLQKDFAKINNIKMDVISKNAAKF